MKRIDLPTFSTVAFTLQSSEVAGGIIMPDGLRHVPMGKIDEESWEELAAARENAGAVMWAAICLEQKLDRVIINFFMGPFSGPSERRHLFENEVVKSSSFQLNFKKQILDRISGYSKELDGKQRSRIQGLLKKVILWRNAFAHGHLKLDAKLGVVLCYYSSSHKQQVLDDSFWSELEAVFRECDSLIQFLEKETAASRITD